MQLSAQSSGNQSLKGIRFLKNKAAVTVNDITTTTAAAGLPKGGAVGVRSGSRATKSLRVVSGVSLESDEEDMRKLLGESLDSVGDRFLPGRPSSMRTADEVLLDFEDWAFFFVTTCHICCCSFIMHEANTSFITKKYKKCPFNCSQIEVNRAHACTENRSTVVTYTVYFSSNQYSAFFPSRWFTPLLLQLPSLPHRAPTQHRRTTLPLLLLSASPVRLRPTSAPPSSPHPPLPRVFPHLPGWGVHSVPSPPRRAAGRCCLWRSSSLKSPTVRSVQRPLTVREVQGITHASGKGGN